MAEEAKKPLRLGFAEGINKVAVAIPGEDGSFGWYPGEGDVTKDFERVVVERYRDGGKIAFVDKDGPHVFDVKLTELALEVINREESLDPNQVIVERCSLQYEKGE